MYNFNCKSKNSVTKQPVKIVKTLQERDNIPCKLRTEGLIVIVTENNYEEYQLRPTAAGDLAQFNTPNVENSISISGRKDTPSIGSNTTSIGNPQTEQTILYGKINLKERLKVQSYTKEQRNALPNKEAGDLIYQTDAGNSGLRFFDGTNWLAIPTTVD